MAVFLWRERLKLVVTEMSRTAALDCARDFGSFLDGSGHEQAAVSGEIDYLFAAHAPCKLFWDGALLEAGTHTLTLDADDSLTLTVPLTRAGFNALPVSLAQGWAAAAEAANGWLMDFLAARLSAMVANANGSSPASVPSPV
jgi:hypothetical protein